jgi:UDP-N-acetylglucosamine:LPS N-acetylglucosamine transferase
VILNLVPNETCAERWRASYPQTPTVVIGCPKLDELPKREPGPLTVAISWHWPASLLISGYAGNALPDFVPQLGPLAKRFNVIGHAHPKPGWPDQMRGIYRGLGIPFVRDFDDVCRQADVLVMDNSSCIFEFAATGRPVVLMNAANWRRGPELGLRFWAASHVGVNVGPNESLVEAVALALADPPEQQAARRDALSIVYQPSLSGAAERGAAAISALMRVAA